MTDDRNANGYFNRGNTLSKGRPRGSRNKPRQFPFTDENDTSAPARRFRVLTLQMVADLGGANNLTAGQKQLIKRCAMISVECERMEKSAMSGGELNAAAYGVLMRHLTRTLSALGFKREPIDVTPALHQYLDTLQPIEPQDLVTTAED
jgi:hypothetical protein